MKILGLNDGSRAAAALVVDSQLVAAGTDVRRKDDDGGRDPVALGQDLLRAVNLELHDVDRVVIGSHSRRDADSSAEATIVRGLRKLQDMALAETGLWSVSTTYLRDSEAARLAEHGFSGDVRTVDRYLALSAAAWRCQPRERALVITASTRDLATPVTVSQGGAEELDLLYRQSGLSSLRDHTAGVARAIGLDVGQDAELLPFRAGDSQPPRDLLQHMRDDFHTAGGGFNLAVRRGVRRSRGPLAARPAAQVAAACQLNLEIQFRRLVGHWIRRTGVRHVALAGGLFANTALNRAIASLDDLDSLFVLPASEDTAAAVGAAMHYGDVGPQLLEHIYLGARLAGEDDASLLKAAGFTPRCPRDEAGELASHLARGEFVVRYSGPASWDRRGAGNRSILCPAHSPDVPQHLESALGRDPVRPLKVLVLADHAERCFELDGQGELARFGTALVPCTAWMLERTVGVTHDGLALPWLLSESVNPALHAIVAAYHQRTDLPFLLMTDLRIPPQPLATTPREVVQLFRESGLDHLQLGSHVVSH